MTEAAPPPAATPTPTPAAPAIDKSVTESTPAVDGHQEQAAVAHPENAHVKTVDAPHSPASSKNSLSSTLKTDGGHGSMDRDTALAKVQSDKTHSHIRAWEESRIAKTVNRCSAKVSKIGAWENSQKAAAESKLKQAEEKLEKKRAALVEKMKNQIAAAHKMAEEKRAEAECQKGEEIFKIEEKAAQMKAKGAAPGGFLCFKS